MQCAFVRTRISILSNVQRQRVAVSQRFVYRPHVLSRRNRSEQRRTFVNPSGLIGQRQSLVSQRLFALGQCTTVLSGKPLVRRVLSLTLSASHGFFELPPGYSRIFSASSCCKHRVPLGLCASKAKHSGAIQVIVSRRGSKVKTGGRSCYKPRKRQVSKLLISLGGNLKGVIFQKCDSRLREPQFTFSVFVRNSYGESCSSS